MFSNDILNDIIVLKVVTEKTVKNLNLNFKFLFTESLDHGLSGTVLTLLWNPVVATQSGWACSPIPTMAASCVSFSDSIFGSCSDILCHIAGPSGPHPKLNRNSIQFDFFVDQVDHTALPNFSLTYLPLPTMLRNLGNVKLIRDADGVVWFTCHVPPSYLGKSTRLLFREIKKVLWPQNCGLEPDQKLEPNFKFETLF